MVKSNKLKRTSAPKKNGTTWSAAALKTKPKGRTPHQVGRERLKELLGGINRVEATGELLVLIRQEDIDDAVQHNALSCPLSLACQRRFASRTIFLSKIAYILLPDEYGEERWVRHVLPAMTQNFVWNFDHYGRDGVQANITLKLMPVTPGRTLKAQAAATRASKQRQVGKKIKPVNPRVWSGRRATIQCIPMLAA